jgi:hypothetical protein
MDLGMILVLVLAAVFFGGVALLSYATRRQQRSSGERPRIRG